jgi:hypothetical protein
MISIIAAALALAAAQAGTPVQSNLEYVAPVAGSWSYAATPTGSEATFATDAGQPQVTIRCTRATRRVSVVKAASAASPTMWVWTSSQSKVLPATFDAPSASAISELAPYDPLLDAIAASRGRVGFSTSGLTALVVPPWAELARVIEDCRA